ncbi:MAG: hypothetical protein M1830_006534, partial [Pleopsidium flavum]
SGSQDALQCDMTRMKKGFHLDKLPANIRTTIYLLLCPNRVVITGIDRSNGWPQHPLLAVLSVFPTLTTEINQTIYKNCKFDFSTGADKIKSSGSYNVISAFIHHIGLESAAYIGSVRFHVNTEALNEKQQEILDVLAALISAPPTRSLADLNLRITTRPPIVSIVRAKRVGYPCFSVNGIVGLDLQIIVCRRPSDAVVSLSKLMRLANLRHVPKTGLNFVQYLPLDIRREIYRYLTPETHCISSTSHKSYKGPPKVFMVCRQMTQELLGLTYGTCYFNLRTARYSIEDTEVIALPFGRCRRFLRLVGARNAMAIRRVWLSLRLTPRVSKIAPLKPVIDRFVERCTSQQRKKQYAWALVRTNKNPLGRSYFHKILGLSDLEIHIRTSNTWENDKKTKVTQSQFESMTYDLLNATLAGQEAPVLRT